MGRLNGHMIDATAQFNVERFQTFVMNTASDFSIGDHYIIAHTQTINAILGNSDGFFSRASTVVDIQNIDLNFLINTGIQVHRFDEVLISICQYEIGW